MMSSCARRSPPREHRPAHARDRGQQPLRRSGSRDARRRCARTGGRAGPWGRRLRPAGAGLRRRPPRRRPDALNRPPCARGGARAAEPGAHRRVHRAGRVHGRARGDRHRQGAGRDPACPSARLGVLRAGPLCGGRRPGRRRSGRARCPLLVALASKRQTAHHANRADGRAAPRPGDRRRGARRVLERYPCACCWPIGSCPSPCGRRRPASGLRFGRRCSRRRPAPGGGGDRPGRSGRPAPLYPANRRRSRRGGRCTRGLSVFTPTRWWPAACWRCRRPRG